MVVVTVDRVFIFVGEGHVIFQADSGLQCRIRVCARVEDLPFGCWARYSLDSSGSVWWFMFSMALILQVCLILSVFHCLSQRRVGCSYALRVSPAVTRLTVYSRPQVMTRRI